jgi:hypothetical protein
VTCDFSSLGHGVETIKASTRDDPVRCSLNFVPPQRLEEHLRGCHVGPEKPHNSVSHGVSREKIPCWTVKSQDVSLSLSIFFFCSLANSIFIVLIGILHFFYGVAGG